LRAAHHRQHARLDLAQRADMTGGQILGARSCSLRIWASAGGAAVARRAAGVAAEEAGGGASSSLVPATIH
jgi:hypothetical protein